MCQTLLGGELSLSHFKEGCVEYREARRGAETTLGAVALVRVRGDHDFDESPSSGYEGNGQIPELSWKYLGYLSDMTHWFG